MNILSSFQENGRIYEVGKRLIEIPADVINQLIQWNIQNQPEDDAQFALAIFFSVAMEDELSGDTISSEVISFISDLLRHRTNGDDSRIKAAIQEMRVLSK